MRNVNAIPGTMAAEINVNQRPIASSPYREFYSRMVPFCVFTLQVTGHMMPNTSPAPKYISNIIRSIWKVKAEKDSYINNVAPVRIPFDLLYLLIDFIDKFSSIMDETNKNTKTKVIELDTMMEIPENVCLLYEMIRLFFLGEKDQVIHTSKRVLTLKMVEQIRQLPFEPENVVEDAQLHQQPVEGQQDNMDLSINIDQPLDPNSQQSIDPLSLIQPSYSSLFPLSPVWSLPSQTQDSPNFGEVDVKVSHLQTLPASSSEDIPVVTISSSDDEGGPFDTSGTSYMASEFAKEYQNQRTGCCRKRARTVQQEEDSTDD